MSDKKSFGWLVLNAAYTFVAFSVALFASMLARTVCNMVIPIETVARQGGDYSHNYLVVFPIHGVVSAIVFLAVAYFVIKKIGFSQGFKHRTTITTIEFIIQAILAIVVYIFLFVYMCELWGTFPMWYLSGFCASIFGIFDPSNVNQYAALLGGEPEPERLYWMYIGLHIAFEAVFLIGSVVLMRFARRKGEKHATEEHAAQLADLEKEKERLVNKKTL